MKCCEKLIVKDSPLLNEARNENGRALWSGKPNRLLGRDIRQFP